MIDPALIPPGWGWALYAFDPAGPVTVELITDASETLAFQGTSALEAWGSVAAFLGAPIADELFPSDHVSDQSQPAEPDGGVDAGQGGPPEAGPGLAPVIDPFS